MEISHRVVQRVISRVRFSVRQRVIVGDHIMAMRMELVGALRGEEYKPEGDCPNPNCGRKLKPAEIIRGFNDDPTDYTTQCTGCQCRFEPRLICTGLAGGARIEIQFFCAGQALAKLRGMEHMSPDQIAADQPGLYRSAIIHHGGVGKAFQVMGIEYDFPETHDWRAKANPFFGKIPDTVIAGCCNVPVGQISRQRRSLKIAPFNKRQVLSEVDKD